MSNLPLAPLSRVKFPTFKALCNARRFPLMSMSIAEADGRYTIPVPRKLAEVKPELCERDPDEAWRIPIRAFS